MRTYTYRHVVTLDETNLVGNVYFARHLHWQGHCRERFLADHAPSVLRQLTSGDLVLVTISCSMRYYAECYALEEIAVVMRLRAASGNKLAMNFEFHRDGQVVAEGTQEVGCMRRSGGRIEATPIPDELARVLESYR
ncbi:acyl-CoA thioesterase [Prauserella halophila]|uniref:Acyl-CoA thioesterase n=1 Tax=Prauserella halophila TaxID=185641 RepID=A0ABP4H0T0_9PSEU|nr:acyl-CoA thioesterase [Prauserella halophila]MCP2234876.1 enediyne biosynthesis thioesterase [Prauserella halophila]